MLTIEKVDTHNKTQVRRFVQIPYRLYAKHPQNQLITIGGNLEAIWRQYGTVLQHRRADEM